MQIIQYYLLFFQILAHKNIIIKLRPLFSSKLLIPSALVHCFWDNHNTSKKRHNIFKNFRKIMEVKNIFYYCMRASEIKIIYEKKLTLYSHENDFYWKANHQLAENIGRQCNFSLQIFKDQIENNFFRQHRQVILKVLLQVPNVQCPQFANFENQCQKISGIELILYVINYDLEKAVFSKQQAFDFRKMLQKRSDWNQICLELLVAVPKPLIWESFFIFYLSLKFIEQKKYFSPNLLQGIEDNVAQFIIENASTLKEKLFRVGLLSNFNQNHAECISWKIHKPIFQAKQLDSVACEFYQESRKQIIYEKQKKNNKQNILNKAQKKQQTRNKKLALLCILNSENNDINFVRF